MLLGMQQANNGGNGGMGGEGKTTKTENSGSSYGDIMCHAKKFELLFCAQEGTIKILLRSITRKISM